MKKKILWAVASLVITVGISIATAIALRTGLGEPTTSTPQLPVTAPADIEIPATTEEQNKKGDEALINANNAISAGDKAKAKQQLSNALALYTAANNQQGIGQVKTSLQVAEAIPATSTPTTTPTSTPTQ